MLYKTKLNFKHNKFFITTLLIAFFGIIGAYFLYGSHASSLSADFNNDNTVNVLDLSILATNWGKSGTASTGDTNNDGTVNVIDLSNLASQWGQVATPTPTPNGSGHPRLVLDQSDINMIKSRIANLQEPQYSAWNTFVSGRLRAALSAAPNVYVGPFRGPDLDTARIYFDQLLNDGSYARNAALGYVFSGDISNANKTKQFLLAWATQNNPTYSSDWNGKDAGQLQSYGAFSMAYAYDLTYNSGVYGSSEKTTIESWFNRLAEAMQSNLVNILQNDYYWKTLNDINTGASGTTAFTGTYDWDATKKYSIHEGFVGSDFTYLVQAACVALAYDTGNTSLLNHIMGNSSNPAYVNTIIAHGNNPHNDGDGVGTKPVPEKQVYKTYVSGRGGMFDYMTYHTRAATVLVDMGENLGFDVSTSKNYVHISWQYLSKFFGPNALPNFNPTDQVNMDIDIPRFTLAYREYGDQMFLDDVNSYGNRYSFYEPQLLGPVTLTHSIIK